MGTRRNPSRPATRRRPPGTNVQLTTSTRAGIGEFTFPATTASLQFDLTNPDNGYVSSTFNAVGDDEVTGGMPGTGSAEPAGQITENGTGRCVDDRDSSTSNFNPVQVYTCNGTDAQRWTVVPDGTLQAFGDCLDVDDSTPAAMAPTPPS